MNKKGAIISSVFMAALLIVFITFFTLLFIKQTTPQVIPSSELSINTKRNKVPVQSNPTITPTLNTPTLNTPTLNTNVISSFNQESVLPVKSIPSSFKLISHGYKTSMFMSSIPYDSCLTLTSNLIDSQWSYINETQQLFPTSKPSFRFYINPYDPSYDSSYDRSLKMFKLELTDKPCNGFLPVNVKILDTCIRFELQSNPGTFFYLYLKANSLITVIQYAPPHSDSSNSPSCYPSCYPSCSLTNSIPPTNPLWTRQLFTIA